MNTDLKTQIEDFATEFAAGLPPVDVNALVDEEQRRPVTTTDSMRPHRIPNWTYAFAAAVAVLILIGGAALLFVGPDTNVVEQPVVPSTLVPSVTTPASTVAESTSEAIVPGPWTSHRIVGNFPETFGVAAFGQRFLTVGQTAPETAQDVWGRGQIWASDDGTSWSPVRWNGTLFEHGHFAFGVLANDSGGVVWGVNARQGGTVILASDNGEDWELVTASQPPLDHGASFTSGIALDSGSYVLYGTPADCFVETGFCRPGEAPWILVSDDGLSWEVVPTPATFSALAQTNTGELVAIGGFISEPTTWISNDEGSTWQQHGPDRSTGGGRSAIVWVLESTPYGLIAAGLDADQQSTLWLSQDNKTFTPTFELPTGTVPNEQTAIEAITYGNQWVVAVGSLETDSGIQPVMWASQDGNEWQPVPLEGAYLGGAALVDVAYDDSVFVAIGNQAYSPGNAGIPLVLRWESD